MAESEKLDYSMEYALCAIREEITCQQRVKNMLAEDLVSITNIVFKLVEGILDESPSFNIAPALKFLSTRYHCIIPIEIEEKIGFDEREVEALIKKAKEREGK